uniref:trypsin n=1 Tax=Sphaeramia orbicularis TaxID=375764 RepID=A0A672Y8Q0_9TELE
MVFLNSFSQFLLVLMVFLNSFSQFLLVVLSVCLNCSGPKACKRGRCGRGECVLTSTPPFYECKCKAPFQPPNCRNSVCDPNPCRNGGRCVQDGNDFDCDCPRGFRGRFCHVGPNDCFVEDGESYRGNVSETDDGSECLFWNSHFILENGADPFNSYEDQDGLGPHNFCRNPDGDSMPWCFYRKGRKLLWDYCDVLECAETTAPPTTAPAPPPRFLTCGRPQPKKQITRIYGGLKVPPGALPWQASVQVRPGGSSGPYRHICGGVVIDSCWVLTAGHCIEPQKDMQVVLGGQNLDHTEPTEQVLTVERVIRHPDYRETPVAVYNDIALLRLNGADGVCANETQFVKSACLPDAALPDGKECTISGWGATEESQLGSTHLLDARVLLINQDKCSEADVYGSVLDMSMFCAGHLQGGVDSCQGDSGGPLTCVDQGVHVVYGLVSWGDQCGKKNKPGVYTRVTHFLDWIRKLHKVCTSNE